MVSLGMNFNFTSTILEFYLFGIVEYQLQTFESHGAMWFITVNITET